MKLTLNENHNISETEVIINCPIVDDRMRTMIDFIRQYSTSLEGIINKASLYVSVNDILYIDSVDRKTYFYDLHRVFYTKYTLTELEVKLENTLFVRISKNCLVNIAYVHSTQPWKNHQEEIIIKTGEHLIVTRKYKESFRQKLQRFKSDVFWSIPEIGANVVYRNQPECSIYNAGRVISFAQYPKRVLALSYEKAELLIALGLADYLVGVSPAECSMEHVLPEYRDVLQNVPLLTEHDRGVPSFSEVEAIGADFVLGSYHSLYTMQHKEGRELDCNRINMYVAESSFPEKATMENVYKDILNIGRVFHIEDRSIRLVEQMRKRVSILTERIAYQRHVRVFVYDSGEERPFTAMGGTLEDNMISIAGGKNIFGKIKKAYQAVSWNEVAEADPEIIIVHDYLDHNDIKKKISLIKSRSEMKNTCAVRNNNFGVVTLPEIFTGIQNVAAIEKIIRMLHPGLL